MNCSLQARNHRSDARMPHSACAVWNAKLRVYRRRYWQERRRGIYRSPQFGVGKEQTRMNKGVCLAQQCNWQKPGGSPPVIVFKLTMEQSYALASSSKGLYNYGHRRKQFCWTRLKMRKKFQSSNLDTALRGVKKLTGNFGRGSMNSSILNQKQEN